MSDLISIAECLGRVATERRLRIIRVLLNCDTMLPVSTIAALAGLNNQQTSFNLTEMLKYGLVLRTTSGKWSFYTINLPVLQELASHLLPSKETPDENIEADPSTPQDSDLLRPRDRKDCLDFDSWFETPDT